jgi:hypothetical protein
MLPQTSRAHRATHSTIQQDQPNLTPYCQFWLVTTNNLREEPKDGQQPFPNEGLRGSVRTAQGKTEIGITKMRPNILIERPEERRDFGIDTTQFAIGSQPAPVDGDTVGDALDGIGLQLSRAELSRIATLLLNAVERCQGESQLLVSLQTNGVAVKIKIRVGITRGVREDGTDLAATREFEISGKTHAGVFTRVIVRLQVDTNGKCWLNLRGNPTTLIGGYNASGLAFKGMNATNERARIIRAPLRFLKQVLREVDGKFRWEPTTRRRIRQLQFKSLLAVVSG